MKLGERQSRPTSNHVLVGGTLSAKSNNVREEIRMEGIKNLFILLGIAIGLIYIIKFFI